MGAGGLLFISFELEWYHYLFFALYLAAVYCIVLLGFVLPPAALVTWARGRRRRALVLGLIGLICLAISVGPPLWDRWQFRRASAVMDAAQVTRVLPDLTGKTVAYVAARPLDDPSLDCTAILRHSGAAAVYMIAPFATAGAPEGLRIQIDRPLDLNALISGRARLADAPPGSENAPELLDERPYCVPEPAAKPLPRIDYFVMRGDDYDARLPFPDLLADQTGAGVYLDWYFGPVADPARFRMRLEDADLVRLQLVQELADYPFNGFSGALAAWPPRGADDPMVQAALCRDGAADCRVN